jgi:iron complex outermembrane receptor protein
MAREAPAGSAAGDAEAGREEEGDNDIVVTGRAARLYRVEETASGKLPTEPLASSQAITVLTQELIKDQGARDAQDLYRNISGVSFFSYAGVTARGFRQQENFYDGLRGDPYIGFSVPQLFNMERVEFLKGPAGMLYGQTAPGGLFNYVTKKPSQTFSGSIGIVGGTQNRYGAQAEVTGPVNDVISLRAGAFFEDRDLPRTFAGNRSLVLDAGSTFDFGIAKLTAQIFRIELDLDANRLRGIPVDNEGHFLADRRWNHNEPSDFLDLRSTTMQARLDLEPTDNLKLDASIRHIDAVETQKYHEPITLLDSNRDGRFDGVARQYRDQLRDNDVWSFAANAIWSTSPGDGISNRLLVGVDYSKTDAIFDGRSVTGRATAAAGLPCPLTFADPVYRACDPARYTLPPMVRDLSQSKRSGLYLLNELTLGRLVAVAGIRTDSFEDVSRPGVGTRSSFKGSDESYRVGLVWRVRDDVSLFAQYATSFEPQGTTAQDPRAGGPFAPTTGDILEGGIKTALMGDRLQSSLSVYKIRRENLLQADPRGDPEGDGVNNSIAFGEVISKGVDFDIAADLTRNWVLTIAYSYNDAKITRNNGRTAITNAVAGGRFANAPRHKLGFWTRYQLPKTGLAFAFGGDYVSRRISLSNQTVNPYMIFDASITYGRGPWEVRARVDNLFDKTYAVSGFNDRGGHFPGEPRSAFVELAYKF